MEGHRARPTPEVLAISPSRTPGWTPGGIDPAGQGDVFPEESYKTLVQDTSQCVSWGTDDRDQLGTAGSNNNKYLAIYPDLDTQTKGLKTHRNFWRNFKMSVRPMRLLSTDMEKSWH